MIELMKLGMTMVMMKLLLVMMKKKTFPSLPSFWLVANICQSAKLKLDNRDGRLGGRVDINIFQEIFISNSNQTIVLEPLHWERGDVVLVEGVEMHLARWRLMWNQHVDDINHEEDQEEEEDGYEEVIQPPPPLAFLISF